MFASLSIALLLVSSVTAQVNKLPDCAKGCATSAATKAQCALSDTSCLCKTTFASSVLQCAGTTSCSSQDQTEVSSILEAMCGPAVTASGSSASGSPLPSGTTTPVISPPISQSGTVSVTVVPTTVTTTITTLSPPQTTTFVSQVTITPSNSVVVPPLSPPLSLPSGSSAPSVTAPSGSSVSPAPSTSPSGAAQMNNARGAGLAVGAVIGAVLLF